MSGTSTSIASVMSWTCTSIHCETKSTKASRGHLFILFVAWVTCSPIVPHEAADSTNVVHSFLLNYGKRAVDGFLADLLSRPHCRHRPRFLAGHRGPDFGFARLFAI